MSDPREPAADDAPLVIVISAWHDDDQVRARVVYGTTGLRHTVTCRSLADLLATVQSLLDTWHEAGH